MDVDIDAPDNIDVQAVAADEKKDTEMEVPLTQLAYRED